MSNRREFLKKSVLGASVLTIPGAALGSVNNWSKMNVDKFISSNWEILQEATDVEKFWMDVLGKMKIGEEFMQNVIVEDEIPGYHWINCEYSKKSPKEWGLDRNSNYKVFLNLSDDHNLLTLKDIDKLDYYNFLIVPGFVVAAKMKDDSIESLHDCYWSITDTIQKEMKECWAAHREDGAPETYCPSQARFVVMQKFGRYDLEYARDNKFIEDGVQPVGKALPQKDSNIVAMKVGMCIFHAENVKLKI